MSQIRILVVPPDESPYPAEIPHTLKSLQSIVGGDIEVIYPFDDSIGIVCNESGKLLGLPLNRALRDDFGEICDIIAGTFLVVGLGCGDFASLSDELMSKYTAVFQFPERFIRLGEETHAIPYNPKAPV